MAYINIGGKKGLNYILDLLSFEKNCFGLFFWKKDLFWSFKYSAFG